MKVQDSSAGRLIERLERDGLIMRERDASDRRVICITLSDLGDKLISNLMPLGVEFNNNLIEGIEEEELKIYEKVLNKMLSNIAK